MEELRKEEPESSHIVGIERDLSNIAHLKRFSLPLIDILSAFPEMGMLLKGARSALKLRKSSYAQLGSGVGYHANGLLGLVADYWAGWNRVSRPVLGMPNR